MYDYINMEEVEIRHPERLKPHGALRFVPPAFHTQYYTLIRVNRFSPFEAAETCAKAARQ